MMLSVSQEFEIFRFTRIQNSAPNNQTEKWKERWLVYDTNEFEKGFSFR